MSVFMAPLCIFFIIQLILQIIRRSEAVLDSLFAVPISSFVNFQQLFYDWLIERLID